MSTSPTFKYRGPDKRCPFPFNRGAVTVAPGARDPDLVAVIPLTESGGDEGLAEACRIFWLLNTVSGTVSGSASLAGNTLPASGSISVSTRAGAIIPRERCALESLPGFIFSTTSLGASGSSSGDTGMPGGFTSFNFEYGNRTFIARIEYTSSSWHLIVLVSPDYGPAEFVNGSMYARCILSVPTNDPVPHQIDSRSGLHFGELDESISYTEYTDDTLQYRNYTQIQAGPSISLFGYSLPTYIHSETSVIWYIGDAYPTGAETPVTLPAFSLSSTFYTLV